MSPTRLENLGDLGLASAGLTFRESPPEDPTLWSGVRTVNTRSFRACSALE